MTANAATAAEEVENFILSKKRYSYQSKGNGVNAEDRIEMDSNTYSYMSAKQCIKSLYSAATHGTILSLVNIRYTIRTVCETTET